MKRTAVRLELCLFLFWGTIAVEQIHAADWPMNQMNPQRVASIESDITPSLKLKWKYCSPIRLGPSILFEPFFTTQTIFCPRLIDGKLYAIALVSGGLRLLVFNAANGELERTVRITRNHVGRPELVADEHSLYVIYTLDKWTSRTARLVAYDRQSFTLKWEREIPTVFFDYGILDMHLLKMGDRLFVSLPGSESGKDDDWQIQVAAIDASSGEILWKEFLPVISVLIQHQNITGAKDHLIASLSYHKGYFFMIDPATGTIEREWKLEEESDNPVSATEKYFFVSEHNDGYGSSEKGEWIYKYDIGGELIKKVYINRLIKDFRYKYIGSSVVPMNGEVVFAYGEGMVCMSEDLERVIWKTKVEDVKAGIYWHPWFSEPIILGRNIAMFSGSNLFLFDKKSGEIVFRYDLKQHKRNFLVEAYEHEINEAIASDDMIYVTSYDGCIYALGK